MPPIQILKTNRPRISRDSWSRVASPLAGFFGVLFSDSAGRQQFNIIQTFTFVAMPVSASFWILLGILALVLVLVTVLLLIAVARRSHTDVKTTQPLPGDQHALTWAVVGGLGIPVAIFIIALILGASGKNASAAPPNPATNALSVQVIGHQWWWEVRYPADGFATANEIHIPAGKTVTFQLTSADVIHSFWVPQLHPKQDMLPGQISSISVRADQPGTYQGKCSEYCGIQHAHMDFLVIAQSQADYDRWVAQQKQPAPAPPVGSVEKKGEQAFLGSSCVYCHTIQGTNASGTLGPDLTHLASRATIGAGIMPNNLNNLAGWIINSQAIKPGNKMPPMNLDSDQLHAILVYLESLK